jgi:hypothetical protein
MTRLPTKCAERLLSRLRVREGQVRNARPFSPHMLISVLIALSGGGLGAALGQGLQHAPSSA